MLRTALWPARIRTPLTPLAKAGNRRGGGKAMWSHRGAVTCVSSLGSLGSLGVILLSLHSLSLVLALEGTMSSLEPPIMPPLRFPKGPDLQQLRAKHPDNHLPVVTSLTNSAASRANDTATSSTASNATAPGTATPGPATRSSTGTSSSPPSATERERTAGPAASPASPFVEPTKSAGILVGVFVSVAVLGYAGLLVWRRVLEVRYGNREILVNEEQFEHERDLGSFQL